MYSSCTHIHIKHCFSSCGASTKTPRVILLNNPLRRTTPFTLSSSSFPFSQYNGVGSQSRGISNPLGHDPRSILDTRQTNTTSINMDVSRDVPISRPNCDRHSNTAQYNSQWQPGLVGPSLAHWNIGMPTSVTPGIMTIPAAWSA